MSTSCLAYHLLLPEAGDKLLGYNGWIAPVFLAHLQRRGKTFTAQYQQGSESGLVQAQVIH
jgi:hypothetical protein